MQTASWVNGQRLSALRVLHRIVSVTFDSVEEIVEKYCIARGAYDDYRPKQLGICKAPINNSVEHRQVGLL